MPDSPVRTIKMTAEDVISANLVALGISTKFETAAEKRERVLSSAVKFAKERGRLASSCELADYTGLAQQSVHKCLQQLTKEGRMVRVGKNSQARFLPLVVQCEDREG